MPKRPLSHQIESHSLNYFESSLPSNWLFRRKDQDYGIDGEVEIFDDKGNATGLLFFVQLKGTDSKEEKDIYNVRIKTDTLSYYRKLNVSVLLVRYSHFTRKIYSKWTSSIDTYHISDKAKSVNINFTEEDEWDAVSWKKILKHLENERIVRQGLFIYPIPTFISLNNNKLYGMFKGVLLSKLRHELQRYKTLITYCDSRDKALLIIKIDSSDLKITISDIGGVVFDNTDILICDDLPYEFADRICFGFAVGMILIGQHDLGIKIILDYKLDKLLLKHSRILCGLLPALMHSSYLVETYEIINLYLDKHDDKIFEIMVEKFSLELSGSMNEKEHDAREKYLIHRIDVSKNNNEPELCGSRYYNLGNHLRSQRRFREAIKYYLLAKRHEPEYLNRPYYYSELGGLFFLISKYNIAAILYNHAINLGSSADTKALYADSLMFSGKYQLAIDTFNDHLSNTDTIRDEWVLKVFALQYIVDNVGDKDQIRNEEDAFNKSLIKDVPVSDAYDLLDEALHHDSLCNNAWFNLGCLYRDANDWENALMSYLICGLTNTNDIESWVNASICAFNSKQPSELMAHILIAAYSLNHDSFIVALYQAISSVDDDVFQSLMFDAIESLVQAMKNEVSISNKKVIRLNGEYIIPLNLADRNEK